MRDLLKFITCGSVDDGKSTLIGHILYDAKLLYADQKRALELDSRVGSCGGGIDYALLLDGLIAEREQGITIDVAYRYFTTDRRSFIVADTPGHEEYTRNMAVGASFADLAVILVDASKGVLTQTRRHARICSLMGIADFVFAVNKMDLVGFDEGAFAAIERETRSLVAELGARQVWAVPLSATEGDNVTQGSPRTAWYEGPALLPLLEEIEVSRRGEDSGSYVPVQRASRPDHTFRGFQGQVEGASLVVGDCVRVLPGTETARVRELLVAGAPAERAGAGSPVTVVLDREVDVSRGCVLEAGANLKVGSSAVVTLLWMDDAPLEVGDAFYVKVGTKETSAQVVELLHAIDVNTGARAKARSLRKNELAVVRLAFTTRVVLDEFKRHATMGELILVNRLTHATSACGVVERVDDEDAHGAKDALGGLRSVLKGRVGLALEFPLGCDGFSREDVRRMERALVVAGIDAYRYEPRAGDHPLEVVGHLTRAGVTVLVAADERTSGELACGAGNLVLRGWHRDVGTDPGVVARYVRELVATHAGSVEDGSYI